MNELVTQYECPILNIGDEKGFWGYINFIEERKLGKLPVMKGVDCIGRPFLILKAEFVLENGATLPTLSTFFQKYVNNKNIWQCYNYIGMELLKTSYIDEGCPINDVQINLLHQLLTHEKITITDMTEWFEHKTESAIVSLQLRCDRISSFY